MEKRKATLEAAIDILRTSIVQIEIDVEPTMTVMSVRSQKDDVPREEWYVR